MKNDSFIKRKAVGIFVLLLFIMTGYALQATAEIQDAKSKLQTDVLTLLHQEKFYELENMAHKFQTEKTRFPDGGWKLNTFYESFKDPYYGWNELLQNLDMWLKKYPDSITVRVASAEAWAKYAWAARGSGYANTVTEENLKLWHERIAKAYEFVKNAPDNPSKDCIHRYKVLLLIGRAQGWDRKRYETLFQEAVSFEPSYYAYYSEKVRYLLPRWYGEKGDWQKFADEAVKLTPKSEGMGIYTKILLAVWQQNEFTEFREPDISWKKMKQGFRDLERNYPNSSLNLNYFCMLACIAGDKETAIEIFKKIGDDPFIEVWKGRSNFYKWQKWAGVI